MATLTHMLRATVRIHVGTYHKELDLSLPATASIGELSEELIEFAGAPRITRPWRASTAAGRRIEPTVPLFQTGLGDGSIIIFSPEETPPAPVIRDAAEALVADDNAAGARGIPMTWAVLGTIFAAAVLHTLLPLPAAGATAGALAFGVAVWARRFTDATPLSITALVLVTAAAALWVADAGSLALISLAAAITGGAGEFFAHLARLHGPRTTAAALACVTMALLASLGACFPGPGVTAAPAIAAASTVLAGAVIGCTVAPGIASRAAGLRVPQLPTAGEDLSVSDTPPRDAGGEAETARRLYSGISLGMALSCVPACASLALTGSGLVWLGSSAAGAGFAQALLGLAAGAIALHASRHREPLAEWALTVLNGSAAAAMVASVWVRWTDWADTGGPRTPWVMLGVAGAIALLAASAPLWARKVPHLEPTTVRWVERAESLAIAACLPLAAHLIGLFSLIRGLG